MQPLPIQRAQAKTASCCVGFKPKKGLSAVTGQPDNTFELHLQLQLRRIQYLICKT
jgi:hypothetical protein